MRAADTSSGDRRGAPYDVLVVTDRRFWRRSKGSEQRIANLLLHLGRSGRRIAVAALDRIDGHDAAAIARFEAQAPGVAVHLRPRRASRIWPGARRRFARSTIERLSPSIVIVEYLRLTDSIVPTGVRIGAPSAAPADPTTAALERTPRPLYWVDTHDVLHRRAAAQLRAGARVPRPIDADTEARWLARYDTILAIQPHEAETFRRLRPDADVIVAPHGLDLPALSALPAPADPPAPTDPAMPVDPARAPRRLGFFGSGDDANRRGLDAFLRSVWPALRARFGAGVELRVGGEVARGGRPDGPGVVAVGPVASIDEFWPTIDIAIAPTPYGSGLSIKNVEALAYARPLITTPIGAEGLEAALPDGLRVAADPAEWIRALDEWITDPKVAAKVGRRGRLAAETCWSCTAAFAALDRRIDDALARRRT